MVTSAAAAVDGKQTSTSLCRKTKTKAALAFFFELATTYKFSCLMYMKLTCKNKSEAARHPGSVFKKNWLVWVDTRKC